MKELENIKLQGLYENRIVEALTQIKVLRENMLHWNKEIERLEKELKQAKTTPVELGFEGNGVNCGDHE